MSDEKFLCHRSVHDDISKRAYKEGAKAERENPCTENGCTDIGNCDEICQHSRIYSPVQMQQAIARATAAENKRVLQNLKKDLESRFIPSSNQWSKGRNSGLLECCNIIDESLRLARPEPTERDPE